MRDIEWEGEIRERGRERVDREIGERDRESERRGE